MNKKIVLMLVLWFSGVQSAWAAPAVVWKTGQTDCRNEAGFVIACAGTGQDADNLPGAAWPSPRFTDNGDGTITDNLTGLIWLKNANCTDTVGGVVKTSGTLHWDSALIWSNNLANGDCGLSDGSAAGDWRLPNRVEVYSLVDFAFFSPAVSNTTGAGQWAPGDPFTNVQSDRYWSSTTYLPDPTSARIVFMDDGSVGYGHKVLSNYYVWPVRGGALFGNSGISASPSSKDFGAVASGSSSSAQTFTIQNTGTNNLYVGTITVTGTDTGQFPAQNDNCSGQTVAPAGACTLQVVFSPTSLGTKSASLSIPSNAAGSPTAVGLAGTGATVPGAPAIGTATAGNGQATVSFTPPVSDGGSAITGYTATSSPDSKTGACASSPCTVTGLTNGTAYTFTVTATNAVGTGAASAASNSVTPVTVPGAPTIGIATGGNGEATVSFTPPASDGGSTITGYTATSSPGSKTGACASSPCTVTGLTNGTAYTFTVTATNGVGTGAASSASNSVTPATVPGPPAIGTATAGNGQATVSFTPPASDGGSAITGYTATSSPDSKTGTCTSSPCTVTGLTNGTPYTFTVTATNGAGTGAASSASNSVTPVTVPGAPAIGTATAGNGQATVSFTPPASDGGSAITGYTATSSPDSKTGTCTSSPCTVTGLTNGTPYAFTVTATNAVGTGTASAASNSVTPAPITITVAAGNDGAATAANCPGSTCRLRDAITAASSGDTIIFDSSVTGTITLTNGELVIDKDLTITGPGASSLTISGGNASRVFSVGSGIHLTLSSVEVADGHAPDGADNGASLGFGGSGDNGGGIYNGGTLTVTNVTFSGNVAGKGGNGSGEHTNNGGNGGAGGGIYNAGILIITNVTFNGNAAGSGGDGSGGDGSTINSGGFGGAGGGIYNAGTLTVMNVTFSGNTAGSGGNGSGGINGNGGNGGDGGGICNNGTLTVTNVTFSGNATGSGGTGSNGGIDGNGGGVYSLNSATITNSTFSGNSAPGSGGGVYNDGIMNLNNTIVAGSISGGDCGNSGSATVNAQNSLIEEGLSCVNGINSNNLTGDPMLGALADNGGPAETMALQSGSPAIDAGDNSFLDEVTVGADYNGDGDTLDSIAHDQRGDGYARVINGAVDMGAYEFSEAPGITSAANTAFTFGSSGSFTVTTTGFPPPALNESGDLPAGVTFSDKGDGAATLSGIPESGTVGTYNIIFTAANGLAPDATQNFTLHVNKADQTITFDALADKVENDADFSISASADSGLPVSFTSTTPGTCTVSGTTISLIAVGTCSITASQAGDTNYNAAADVIQSFNVLATVSPSAGANGSITPDTPQTVMYNQTLNFTVTPDTGYHVDVPVGGACGGTYIGDPYDNINGITFTINAVTDNCSVAATFSINTYTVSASVGVGGILDAGTPSPKTLYHGDTATFTFNADTGYHVESVTGCGLNYINGDNVVTTYTAPTDPVTDDCQVIATFAKNGYLLTVTVDDKGSATSDSGGIDCPGICSAQYDYNTVVVLTATPVANGKFIGWSGDPDCEDGVVTMTSDIRCSAEFYKFPWTIFLLALISNGGH